MSVQSFITIMWQEKKLSMIKIFKCFVSDHLNAVLTFLIAGKTANELTWDKYLVQALPVSSEAFLVSGFSLTLLNHFYAN